MFEKCESVKEGFKARTVNIKNRETNLISYPKMIIENVQEYIDNCLNDSTKQNTVYSSYEKLEYQTAEPK